MGILKKSLQEKQKKEVKILPGSVTEALSIQTGFDIIDYRCATICINEDGEEFLNLGLPMGKIIEAIGNSQGGKSTLIAQIAWAMASPLNGDIVYCDFERGLNNPEARLRQITGCSEEEYHNTFTIFNQIDLTTEFFKKLIFDIAEMKKKLTAKDMVEWLDFKGNTIKIYPPTIVILDSVPAMKPKEVVENPDLDNNMIPGKMAASNKAMLTSVVSILEQYNITILAINHITTKINTNAYAPRKVQLPGLGDDENLPGGNCWSFMPSYVFKLTSGAEMKADKDLQIEGRATDVRFIKTRSGFNNSREKFILTAKKGFSNVLANFMHLKENGFLVGGGKSGFSLKGHEEWKFTQKQFIYLYNSDEGFQEAFNSVINEVYSGFVQDKYTELDGSSSENELAEEFGEEE
jgi:RecA/RadA recombinase